jgi:hypothetical protein
MNIDLWNYWWYGAPVIFALGCILAGIWSRTGTDDQVGGIILLTIFAAFLWPLILPVAVVMGLISIPGYGLFHLGKWISGKF